MPRLFQIHEENLAELERLVPELGEALNAAHITPCQRTQLRRCKMILSNIRWNYGPPTEFERIATEDK